MTDASEKNSSGSIHHVHRDEVLELPGRPLPSTWTDARGWSVGALSGDNEQRAWPTGVSESAAEGFSGGRSGPGMGLEHQDSPQVVRLAAHVAEFS